jgi:N-acetylglutamate synthase-like GNAT family acetyltransferase
VAAPTKAVSGEYPAGFRVRDARRGDGDGIAALLKDLGYPGAAEFSTVNWVVSHPEIEIFVATDGRDRPVGLLSMSHRPQLRMNGRLATVDELVVAESWRRRGVGRALLKHAVEKAKTLTCKRIELVTHRGRGDYVRQFYAACGFSEVDSMVLRFAELDFQRR